MDWTDAVSKSVKRMERINPPDIEDEIGITDSSLYESVVKSLTTNSKASFQIRDKCIYLAAFRISLTKILKSNLSRLARAAVKLSTKLTKSSLLDQ